MLYSMTGYAKVEKSFEDKGILIEIRSLNGKQFDLKLSLPTFFRSFEIEIRNLLSQFLERGSVECSVTIRKNGSNVQNVINIDIIKSHYQLLQLVATDLQVSQVAKDSLFSSVLQLPDIFSNTTEPLSAQQWEIIKTFFTDAMKQLIEYRKKEGSMLETDLLHRIYIIQKLAKDIEVLEPFRSKRIKEELQKKITELMGDATIDENRLAQEMVYYIEKIDIHEEQVRLDVHCNYFIQVIKESENSKGRKLSFILQEIGREINTLGSKAHDVAIQKIIVQMKDELEKAKEQTLNIL